MATFESALAGIPGYGGYLAKQQLNREETLTDLKTASGIQGMIAQMQAQQREQKLRSALSSLSPEQQADPSVVRNLYIQHASPHDALTALSKTGLEGAPEIVKLQAYSAQLRAKGNTSGADQIDAQVKKLGSTENAASQESANYLLETQRMALNGETIPIERMNKTRLIHMQMIAPRVLPDGSQTRLQLPPEFDPNVNFGIGQPAPQPAQPTAAPTAAPIAAPTAAPVSGAMPFPAPGSPDYAAARFVASGDRMGVPTRATPTADGGYSPSGGPGTLGQPLPTSQAVVTPGPTKPTHYSKIAQLNADLKSGAITPEQHASEMKAYLSSQQDKASLKLPESGLGVYAWEKLLFGKDPPGMGTATAIQRAQVADMRAKIGRDLGLSDMEMAMLPQDNKVKMKAVDALTKWGAFLEKSSNQLVPSMDLAIDYARKIDPTTMRTLNKLIIAGKTEFNDPTVNAYALALNTVRNEYGRLMSGPTSNAMLPVEAMKKGDSLISAALDVPSLEEMKKVIIKDAEFTTDAVHKQIDTLRGSIMNPSHSGTTPGGALREFATEAQARAAGHKSGDRVKIGGQPGTLK